MFIDSRGKDVHHYDYSLIQYKNILTHENYNLGFVLFSNDRKMVHAPSKINILDNCLDLKEHAGINYSIKILKEDVLENDDFLSGNISNSLSLSELYGYSSKKSIEEVYEELLGQFITLKKLRTIENEKHLFKYDKRFILNSIDGKAKELGVRNFVKKHLFPISHRQIDMAIVDKNNNPYVVSELASLHVDSFDDSLDRAIIILQQTILRDDIVKDRFLYVPKKKDVLNKLEIKRLSRAKELTKSLGFDIITDPNEEAVLERLQQYKLVS